MVIVYVLSDNFEIVKVIDQKVSLIWTTRYYTAGDFELYVGASAEMLEVMKAGRYLVRSMDAERVGSVRIFRNVMMISDIELVSDAENGDKLIVKGSDLKSILQRRVIASQTVIRGAVDQCITDLLDATIINPSDTARQISTFVRGGDDLLSAYSMEMQLTGDVLLDAVTEICQNYGYGFDIMIDNGNFVFWLYEGRDRSFDQTTLPRVIFSDSFDNLLSSDYAESRKNYANVAYVAGEGEGSERAIVSVGDAEGLNRIEIWVDARNASTNNGEISDADYKKQLAEEGVEKLAETVVTAVFSGEVEFNTNFVLNKDYFLGDLVQVKNGYGISAKTRIVEIIDSEDENGRKVIVTLAEWVQASSWSV